MYLFCILSSFQYKMTSGADVAKEVDKYVATEKIRAVERENVDKDTTQKAEVIKKIVHDNANPHPALICLGVLIVVLVMYICYLIWIRPCASGQWVDESGVEYNLTHNKLDGRLNGTLYRRQRKVDTMNGEIVDNYVVLGNVPGVWDYADNIMLFNGTMIKRYKQ